MLTDTLTQKRARQLRRPLTQAERILWSRLKGRKLGVHFRAQHPVSPYIADFACVNLKLLVEVDGEAHSSAQRFEHDERRRVVLEQRGWTIVRVRNEDVYRHVDDVVGAIAAKIEELRGRSPPPSR